MRSCFDSLDTRIRRTRQTLHGALRELLSEKCFGGISVQDITSRSTLNRATFYDHFTDKYALLEDMIGEVFREMFARRMAGSDGNCHEGQKQLVLTVCEFLDHLGQHCQTHHRQFAPIVEAKIKSLLREYLVCSLRKGDCGSPAADLELKATMASWAIYGAALEWERNTAPCCESFASSILPHISRILEMPEAATH